MIVYKVIMGVDEFDPFGGSTRGHVHRTLKGAWEELGAILDKMFEEYRSGQISKIHNVYVSPIGRRVIVAYEKLGSPGIFMVTSLYIQVNAVTL